MRRPNDLLPIVVIDLIALVGLVVAWFGVSGALVFADQTGALSLGVAAVALAGVGNALFLINQRRALSDRIDAVLNARIELRR